MGMRGTTVNQQQGMLVRVAAPIEIMQLQAVNFDKVIDRFRRSGRRRRIVVHLIPLAVRSYRLAAHRIWCRTPYAVL